MARRVRIRIFTKLPFRVQEIKLHFPVPLALWLSAKYSLLFRTQVWKFTLPLRMMCVWGVTREFHSCMGVIREFRSCMGVIREFYRCILYWWIWTACCLIKNDTSVLSVTFSVQILNKSILSKSVCEVSVLYKILPNIFYLWVSVGGKRGKDIWLGPALHWLRHWIALFKTNQFDFYK